MPYSVSASSGTTGSPTTLTVDEDVVKVEVMVLNATSEAVYFSVDGSVPDTGAVGVDAWMLPASVISALEVGCSGRPVITLVSASGGVACRVTGITAAEDKD